MSETLQLRGTLIGHNGWVTQIATNPKDPDTIISASRGKYASRSILIVRLCGIWFNLQISKPSIDNVYILVNIYFNIFLRLQTRLWLSGSWPAMRIPTTVTPRSVCTDTRTSSATLCSRPTATTLCPVPGIRLCVCGIWLPARPLAASRDTPRWDKFPSDWESVSSTGIRIEIDLNIIPPLTQNGIGVASYRVRLGLVRQSPIPIQYVAPMRGRISGWHLYMFCVFYAWVNVLLRESLS